MKNKFKIDYATFLAMSQCLATKIKEEFDPHLIACIPRGGLSFSHILSLELGIPCVMHSKSHRVDYQRVLVVDDSIGSGKTFKEVDRNNRYSEWEFAAFYVDDSFDTVNNDVKFYCMKTPLWVVLPWEDEEKIIVGDRNSLFRNGSDPYQRKD